jgi:hypothetical protein
MIINNYRKKPVVIKAARVTDDTVHQVAAWCKGKVKTVAQDGVIKHGIGVDTLEGTMLASPGDYIIQGIQGEFYPCKPDIFEQTYEKEAA